MLHRVEMQHLEVLIRHSDRYHLGLQDIALNVSNVTLFVTRYGFRYHGSLRFTVSRGVEGFGGYPMRWMAC